MFDETVLMLGFLTLGVVACHGLATLNRHYQIQADRVAGKQDQRIAMLERQAMTDRRQA